MSKRPFIIKTKQLKRNKQKSVYSCGDRRTEKMLSNEVNGKKVPETI